MESWSRIGSASVTPDHYQITAFGYRLIMKNAIITAR
jgi:hypothetical protein